MDKKSIAYSNEKNRLKAERISAANYFITHNQFEYEKVSLMEIAFTFCVITSNASDIYHVNENLLHSRHDELRKRVELNRSYQDKDVKEPPYFISTGRYEYWVSKDTAQQLITTLKAIHVKKHANINYNAATNIAMLLHVRQGNKTKRIDQITSLLLQICVNDPIKIDESRITEPIKSMNLGWILAICLMGYKSFSEVNFESPILDSLAHNIIEKINIILTQSGMNLGIPTCYDEYDLPTLTSISKIYSYNLTPELISLITKHDDFRSLFLSKILPIANIYESNREIIIDTVEPNKNQSNSIKELRNSNENKKKQLQIKLKNDNNRPSENCRDRTQRITLELEEIIIDGHLDLDEINFDSVSV